MGTLLAYKKNMKRILLIGQDPLFAWALEKKISPLGFHLEHVYTLTEAKLRISRFRYEAFLLDGLSREEANQFSQQQVPGRPIFVLRDVEDPASASDSSITLVNKEKALSDIPVSLQSRTATASTA